MTHQVLSAMILLCRGKAEQSNSLCIVSLNSIAILETYS
jgi:hypothetical protein